MTGYADKIAAMSVQQLEQAIRHHNAQYWDHDRPEISDYDYDLLVSRLRSLAPQSPLLSAFGAERFGDPVEHASAMLSLDKCYSDEELAAWSAKFSGDVVASPKLDGIACSLRYDAHGRLAVAATRGNGTVGDDITTNARQIEDIPRQVSEPSIEVRGEIYMRLSTFARFRGQFANPRNLAAGAIKNKDAARFREYGLSFAAYDLLGASDSSELSKLRRLAGLGFGAVEYRLSSQQELPESFAYFAAKRGDFDFEIDGVVFKADRLSEQRRLGATAHHPRYAIAYKFQGDSARTTLQDVTWSVARTGAVTPVARVAPVSLSGATISRASLHNAGFIAKKNLSLGAVVVVTRRGGVIPNVEFVVEPGDQPVTLPQRCPSCGGELVARASGNDESGQLDFLYCKQPKNCRDALIGAMAHFCHVVDIQGFGEKLLAEGFDKGVLRTPADFFRLEKDELLRFERVGEKLADKLLAQVAAHRTLELSVFLRALGIDELGSHVAALLAQHCGSLERVRRVDAETLAQLHGVGDTIAEKVVSGLRAEAVLIDALLQQVSVATAKDAVPSAMPLSGKSFVFTGKLLSFDRKQAQAQVRELGGSTPSGVTRDLTYLVLGAGKESAKSSKLKKAEAYIRQDAQIRIIAEDDFVELVNRAAGLSSRKRETNHQQPK